LFQELLPEWIRDGIRGVNCLPRGKDDIAFLVQPIEGEAALAPTKYPLSSRRMLRILKVADYLRGKLGKAADGCDIHIFCKGKLVEPSATLAAVKQFFWKSSNDLILEYKLIPLADMQQPTL
jgi:hypothetical protein